VSSGIINIPWISVAAATLFIFGAGLCSILLRLGLQKDILIGTLRTFLQLFLLGYVLKTVFSMNNPWVIILLFIFMIAFAARIISGRVREKRIPYFLPVLASMFLSYLLINFTVMEFIINVDPWYRPVYFIPIGGMIIGNDLDALLSAALLKHRFGWDIAGIYDFNRLWYPANFRESFFLKQLVSGNYMAVDLDIYRDYLNQK